MRVSFDLDEVLFVSEMTHKTEPPLKFPFNKIYKERLRLGTCELLPKLRSNGFEVWIYTSSYRTERYIRGIFKHYGITLDGIVNAQRHKKEVQRDNATPLPSKMPGKYRISLHIDDESIVCSHGKKYGFNVFQLNAQDDEWAEKILSRLAEIQAGNERRKISIT